MEILELNNRFPGTVDIRIHLKVMIVIDNNYLSLKKLSRQLSISNALFISFVCDLCDGDSAIGKHSHDAHGRSDPLNESHFKILRKC